MFQPDADCLMLITQALQTGVEFVMPSHTHTRR